MVQPLLTKNHHGSPYYCRTQISPHQSSSRVPFPRRYPTPPSIPLSINATNKASTPACAPLDRFHSRFEASKCIPTGTRFHPPFRRATDHCIRFELSIPCQVQSFTSFLSFRIFRLCNPPLPASDGGTAWVDAMCCKALSLSPL